MKASQDLRAPELHEPDGTTCPDPATTEPVVRQPKLLSERIKATRHAVCRPPLEMEGTDYEHCVPSMTDRRKHRYQNCCGQIVVMDTSFPFNSILSRRRNSGESNLT